MSFNRSILFGFLAAFLFVGHSAFGQDSNSNGSGSHVPGPKTWNRPIPKEALDACAGKGKADECSFTSPRGDKITGVCWAPPPMKGSSDSPPLACKPSHGWPQKGGPASGVGSDGKPEAPPTKPDVDAD